MDDIRQSDRSLVSPSAFHCEVIDRDSRTRLVATIERFLASEMTAFEFDEALEEWRTSKDPVVRYVVDEVWNHYDDCDDHLVVMTKAQWDLFQRLLLLLRSDCSLQTETIRTWSWTQLTAAMCFSIYVVFVVARGWGQDLIAIWMLLGLVSMLLSKLRREPEISRPHFYEIIYPFASFSDLKVAYGSVRFVKKRYPQEIGDRRLRTPYREATLEVSMTVGWLIYAPVILLFQVFPQSTLLASAKSKVASTTSM